VRIWNWWRQRRFERTTGPSSSEGRRCGGLRPKATRCGAEAQGSEWQEASVSRPSGREGEGGAA
jgi:hypothetical protein